MSDSEPESESSTKSPSPSKKLVKEKDVEKPAGKAHPPTATMVTAAIKGLDEKKGSSITAIKKYIAATYNVDPEKQAIYIKKYVKNAVISGELVQTSGKGASGSFRFPTKSDKAKKKAAEQESSDKEGAGKSKKEETGKSKKEESGKSKKGVPAKSKKEKPSNEEPASPKKKKAEAKKGSKPSSPEKKKKSEKSPTKLKPPRAKKADKPSSPKKTSAKPKGK